MILRFSWLAPGFRLSGLSWRQPAAGFSEWKQTVLEQFSKPLRSNVLYRKKLVDSRFTQVSAGCGPQPRALRGGYTDAFSRARSGENLINFTRGDDNKNWLYSLPGLSLPSQHQQRPSAELSFQGIRFRQESVLLDDEIPRRAARSARSKKKRNRFA